MISQQSFCDLTKSRFIATQQPMASPPTQCDGDGGGGGGAAPCGGGDVGGGDNGDDNGGGGGMAPPPPPHLYGVRCSGGVGGGGPSSTPAPSAVVPAPDLSDITSWHAHCSYFN